MNRLPSHKSLLPLIVIGCVAMLASKSHGAQLIETFDSSPPHWSGVNNTSGINNFGWSNTSNAGLAQGEIGGLVGRDAEIVPAGYYSTEVGSLDPSSAGFTFSGTGVFTSPHMDYSFLGYFTPSIGTLSGYPKNYIGLYSDDRHVALLLLADGSFAQTAFLPQLPIDTPFQFSVTYDPSANGGYGSVTANVGGSPLVIDLPESRKDEFANLTNFGMHTRNNLGGPSTRQTATFFDNLSYTSQIPEPSSFAMQMIAILIAGVLRKPWRNVVRRAVGI